MLRQYNLKLAVTAISLGPPCGFAVQDVQTVTVSKPNSDVMYLDA